MGQMIGADVQQLRQLVTSFTGAAKTLDSTVTALRPALQRSTWKGPDATRFGNEWFGRLSPQLTDASRRLTDAARVLTSDADEQERTSEGGRSIGGSGTGGGTGNGGGSGNGGGTTESGFPTTGTAWFGGDSYASGEGTYDYFPESNRYDYYPNPPSGVTIVPANECHRATDSYQAQAFAQAQSEGAFAGQDYSTQACSGAIVSDLYSNNHSDNRDEGPQMYSQEQGAGSDKPFDNIPADASLISLSMGGNDLGFAGVLENCITGSGEGCGDSSSIQGKIDEVYGTADKQGTLEVQIAKVREEHPDARIVLVGYPPLFSEQRDLTKFGLTTMDVSEQAWANDMSGNINVSGAAMADRLGVEWLDPTPAYVGDGYDHRIGSPDPYINDLDLQWAGVTQPGLSVSASESFHPNQAGHDAMTDLFLEHIKNGQR